MSFPSDRLLDIDKIKELAALIIKCDVDGSRDLINPLFELLLGKKLDTKDDLVIQDANVILLLFELLPQLSETVQFEILTIVIEILSSCQQNLQICCKLPIIEQCLKLLKSSASSKIAVQVGSLMRTFAEYSVSSNDLKSMLLYLTVSKDVGTWAPHSKILLNVLNTLSTTLAPTAFFSFSGLPEAVMTLPPLSKWSPQSGFTFYTWICIENPADLRKDFYKPVILWFRTGKKLGYSLHLDGNQLVVETQSKIGKKPQTNPVNFNLQSNKWYMVTMVYHHHMIRSSELMCYINDKLVLQSDCTMPNTTDVFDKCFLGSSPSATIDSVFRGQIAAVYFFKEPQSANVVSCLYKLGPCYCGQFKFASESDVLLTEHDKKLLFSGHLSESILFTYNARATNGQLCLQASPNDTSAYFESATHASMVEGVVPVIVSSFHDALHPLGGIKALCPLLSQLDNRQHTDAILDESFSAELVSLILNMTINSESYLNQLVDVKAFHLIGYLLEKASPVHLTEALCSCLLDFVSYLLKVPNGKEPLKQFLVHIIFNAALWVKAKTNVQLFLYTHIALHYGMEPYGDGGWDLKEFITVQHLLYIIRKYYSYSEDGADESHSCLCAEVRPYLILTIKQFITRKKGVADDELVGILDYIATSKGVDNLKDILELLIALMFEGRSITSLLIENDCINTCLLLLCAKEEIIQCYGLKVICKIIYDTQQSKYATFHDELLLKVKQKFLEVQQATSIEIFNCLYELMVCAPTRYIIDGHFVNIEDSHVIVNSYVVCILAELLTIQCGGDLAEINKSIKLQFLSCLYALCCKNKSNCKALMDTHGWLKSLIMLATSDDVQYSDDLNELRYKITSLVLQYCIENMQDGWKEWVKIAAWLYIHDQALDSANQQLEYFQIFQPFESLDINNAQVNSDQPKAVFNTDVHASPEKEKSLKLHLDKDDSTSQCNVLYDQLPSPRLLKKSSSFSGKKAKFIWTSGHFRILCDVLEFAWGIIENWKSLSEKQYEELFKSTSHIVFLSNTAHIIALSIDSCIAQAGGLKPLLSLSTKKALKESLEIEARILKIFELSMNISKMIVLERKLRFSLIEGRLRMPPTGMQRQCLRLVLCLASLDTVERNAKFEEQRVNFYCQKADYQQLHSEADELFNYLGYHNYSISNYLHTRLTQQEAQLSDIQCCLNQDIVTNLQLVLNASHTDSKSHDVAVLCIVYYLSVMTITFYKTILESTDIYPVEPTKQLYTSFSRESLVPKENDPEVVSPVDKTITEELSFSKLDSDSEPVSAPSPLKYHKSSSSVSSTAVDLSEQLEATLAVIAPWFCQLFKKFKNLLCKTFVGSNGKPVLFDALPVFQESCTATELAMSLCSQALPKYELIDEMLKALYNCLLEIQWAIKNTAAKVFNELINEGKQLSTFCDSYLKSIAETEVNFVKDHSKSCFQIISQGNQSMADYLTRCSDRVSEDDSLRSAAAVRHNLNALTEWKKILQSVNEEASLETLFNSVGFGFWKLCFAEDSRRRRMKLVANSQGSTHLQASRKNSIPDSPDFDITQAQAAGYELNTKNEELQELLEDEDIIADNMSASVLTINCAILMMAFTVPGVLTLSKSSFSFNPKDIDALSKVSNQLDTSCFDKWQYSDITAVFSRSYLHQRRAAEVFFSTQMATFFVFDNFQAVKQFVKHLPKVGVGRQYGLPITRSISLASPLQLFKKSNMLARWQKREISNFEYLMFLNTIAGRSYNDLGQYPVFPWILKDYTSEELDLSNPAVYRDLSKPIGLLNPSRFQQFESRYNSMDDSMPKFMFGTHYSTMAYTIHWLVRVEPYTSIHIDFNGGYFDDPNRIFFSIEEAWNNCLESTSDVRELIPELFFLPQMFVNDNKFELGTNDFGQSVDNVKLPPWANSPVEFIRLHKEALESDYVSDNLHHWVDLIFGYKQNGKAAVEAKNLFYYLTYPGSVNLESLDDIILKKSLEEQVKSFGQTPNQLLKDPHPPRNPPVKVIQQCLSSISSEILNTLEVTPDSPIIMLHPEETLLLPRSVLSVSANYFYCIANWNIVEIKHQPTSLLDLSSKNNSLKQRGISLAETGHTSCFCTTTTPDNLFIFTCGASNNSFQIHNSQTGILIQSVFGHHGTVLCLDYSQDYGLCSNNEDGIVASGSSDSTVMLWKWSGQKCCIISSTSESSKSSVAPIAVLTGHHTPIVCIAVNCSLGIVASGAMSDLALLHSTKGDLLCRLLPTNSKICAIFPNSTVITCDGNVILQCTSEEGGLIIEYSCNGQRLSSFTLNKQILVITISTDGKYMAVSCTGGTIMIMKLSAQLKLIYTYTCLTSDAMALSFSEHNQILFVGTSIGTILALSTHQWSDGH